MSQNEQNDDYSEQEEFPGLIRSFFVWLASIEWVAAIGSFMALQWRAMKVHSARMWFHFRRGQKNRRQRDQQTMASSWVAKTARKVGAAPVALWDLSQTNRAWFFTTVTGTIGLILLLLWFYDLWTIKTEPVVAAESTLGAPAFPVSDLAEPLIITEIEEEPFEFPVAEPPVVELSVESGLVFEQKPEELNEEFLVVAPEIPYFFPEVNPIPDDWKPYQVRPVEFPEAPVKEPSFDFEAEDEYPKVTFNLDEPYLGEPIVEQPSFPEVAEPKLTLTVKQPQTVRVGQWIPVTFIVKNIGEVRVTNISLQTELPDQVQHDKGRNLAIVIPVLEPGETQEVKLAPQARQVGRARMAMKLLATGFEQELSRETKIASRPETKSPKTHPPVDQPRCCPGEGSSPAPVYQPVYSQPNFYQPVMGLRWYQNPIGRW